jgi:hypothetical protein
VATAEIRNTGPAVHVRSVLIETTAAEDAALPPHLDSIKRSRAFHEQNG